MKRLFTTLILLLPGVLIAQLTILVDDIPLNTPEGAQIYIAGDFQGWDPGDPDYALTFNGDGTYSIILDISPSTINFKFTRGSWDTVEGNENGGFLPDRNYTYAGGEVTLTLQILSWEDLGGNNSTAAENVEIIDTDFYIPQLDRYRRIWVYTPPNYDETDLHYKVLYMHDGQNLFDVATSFAGEWEVDETLNELFAQGDEGCIVVGIDNGSEHRIDEYGPWVNAQYGGGEGPLYMEFIVSTLKPYIDENYRTRPEREWTGIMGSSLGGLISTYGGFAFSETFSRIGAFSPSYWFNPEIYDFVGSSAPEGAMRIYTVAGQLEGNSMTNGVASMDDVFEGMSFGSETFFSIIQPNGTHSEGFWASQFEAAYEWLWQSSTGWNEFEQIELQVYPNPANEAIYLSFSDDRSVDRVELCSLDGTRVYQHDGWTRLIENRFAEGVYLLSVYLENGDVISQRVILRS